MHANNNNTPPGQGSSNSDQFSIATRTVTTILPMAGDLSDTSFLSPSTPYQQEMARIEQPTDASVALPDQRLSGHVAKVESESPNSAGGCTTGVEATKILDSSITDCSENSSNPQDDASKSRKRNKTSKKNGKLDARSKLEKSRQSARECRARKKLRYQYLEDLVCNREKAVVKLREELATFCELSKRIDSSSITDADRKLLLDQNTDNNRG